MNDATIKRPWGFNVGLRVRVRENAGFQPKFETGMVVDREGPYIFVLHDGEGLSGTQGHTWLLIWRGEDLNPEYLQ